MIENGGNGSGSSDIVVETGATRGVKRADIDFEAFSDAKRRKPNEKGGKGKVKHQQCQ